MNHPKSDKRFELLATKNQIRCIISLLKKQNTITTKQFNFLKTQIKKKTEFFENLLLMINNLESKTNKIVENIILQELEKKTEFFEVGENNISSSTYNYNSIFINDSQSSRESSPIGDSLLKTKIFRDIGSGEGRKSLKSFAFQLKKV